MSKVILKANDVGLGTVLLDGQDISASVRRISIEVEAGALTKVHVTLLAERLDLQLDGAHVALAAELPEAGA